MPKDAAPTTSEGRNWEHLTDELALLNASLLREVNRLGRDGEAGRFDQFQGLVLSEQEVLAFLDGGLDDAGQFDGGPDGGLREIEERISGMRGGGLRRRPPLIQLAELFQLERIEEQCVVLCLAPEIDWRYSKVFAFLQDDVTKRGPSVDLALRLFCTGAKERVEARAVFSPNASLLKNRLVHLGESEDGHCALPQSRLRLDERVAAFLLETPQLDDYLSEWVEFVAPSKEAGQSSVPDEFKNRLTRLVEGCFAGGEAPVRPLLHLYGRQGAGRRALAECVSRGIGLPLLAADVRRMPAGGRAEALWRLGREALLLPAAILVEHFDDLLHEGREAELAALMDSAQEFSPLTCLSGTRPWAARRPEQFFLSLECAVPDAAARAAIWREHLRRIPHSLADDDVAELASKFNFTGGQITEAVEAANDRSFWESQPPQPVDGALLTRACRGVATPQLGALARKIEPCHTWSDIVLPESQMTQLHELASHVRRAQVVLDAWGFARKFPASRGVTAMFQGMSGTGKTMAAGIVGAELGLDLYKIDLSCVVSKYIGETEKNLSSIFAEAQDSNAILFFDEADALFGKRSEVKDAHDRYANIETAYLLQRMEEYSGIVILATNMKQNIDEAFVRRMRFIIQFPFPDDAERECIWEKMFPRDAPLGDDVDFGWMARKLKVTGGHIRNISLRAAFLASERRGVIGMDCLVEAARRELRKLGKLSPLEDFRPAGRMEDVFGAAAEVA